jgi:hypothetical protein
MPRSEVVHGTRWLPFVPTGFRPFWHGCGTPQAPAAIWLPSDFQEALPVHVGPPRVTRTGYMLCWPLAASMFIATFPEPL